VLALGAGRKEGARGVLEKLAGDESAPRGGGRPLGAGPPGVNRGRTWRSGDLLGAGAPSRPPPRQTAGEEPGSLQK